MIVLAFIRGIGVAHPDVGEAVNGSPTFSLLNTDVSARVGMCLFYIDQSFMVDGALVSGLSSAPK